MSESRTIELAIMGFSEANKVIDILQSQLKEAREVIEFYGNRDIWDPEIGFIDVPDRDSDFYHGKKARDWLEKWKETK